MKSSRPSVHLAYLKLLCCLLLAVTSMIRNTFADDPLKPSLYGSWTVQISDLEGYFDPNPKEVTYILFVAPLENDLQPGKCWSYLDKVAGIHRDHC